MKMWHKKWFGLFKKETETERAFRRACVAAKNAGITFEEVQNAFLLLQNKTGRSPSVISNGLKTIFTRLERPEIQAQLAELLGGVYQINLMKVLIKETLKNYKP